MAITTQQQSNIIALTVGMFNAAPGAQFLSEFANIFENNGQSYQALADALASTNQYQSQFNGIVTQDGRIDKVLSNLGIQSGTDAYTTAKAHFEARIAEGASETELVVESLEYLLGDDAAAEFADVQAQLNNKVEVATFYSVEQQQSADNLDDLQAVVSSVTADDATVEAAKNDISNSTGQTFTLTNSVDNFPGTAGNDTFRGDNTTISGADSIDGGAGTDKAELFFAQAGTYQLSSQNVEQFFLQSTGGGAATFNAINVADAEQFWSNNSTQTLNVSNIQEQATIGVRGGNGSAYFADFNNTLTSGTTDAVDVVLDGANVGNLGVSGTATATNANEFETINLNAVAGTNTVTTLTQSDNTALVGTQTVNVTGTGSLAVTTALSATVTTLDASENTGGVQFAFNAGNTTVTGGEGNDRFLFGANFNANDTVAGGAGVDTLGANGAQLAAITTNLAGVSGIETLELQDNMGGADRTVNAANFGGDVENFRVANQGATTENLVVNGLKAAAEGSNNIRFDGSIGGATAQHAFNITGATDPQTANSVTLDMRGANSTGADIQLAGVESVTIDTSNNTSGAVQFDLVATALEDLTVQGVQSVNLSGAALGANVESVDASGLTNGASLNVALSTGAATGANITGSAANDTIQGSNLKDVINAGAGNDVIVASGGQDVITLGAGQDAFQIAAAANVVGAAGANMVSITDFVSGTDTIQFVANGSVLNGVTFDGTGDKFADMANVLNSTTAVNSAADVYTQLDALLNTTNFAASAADGTATVAQVVEFTQGSAAGKYLVINDAAADFQAATDIVINITGQTGTFSAADFSFA